MAHPSGQNLYRMGVPYNNFFQNTRKELATSCQGVKDFSSNVMIASYFRCFLRYIDTKQLQIHSTTYGRRRRKNLMIVFKRYLARAVIRHPTRLVDTINNMDSRFHLLIMCSSFLLHEYQLWLATYHQFPTSCRVSDNSIDYLTSTLIVSLRLTSQRSNRYHTINVNVCDFQVMTSLPTWWKILHISKQVAFPSRLFFPSGVS